MSARLSAAALAVSDFLCLALAAAIAFHAIRDWPARYAHHTLSWSVSAFFIVSMALAVSGPLAALVFLRNGDKSKATSAALAPGVWFGFGGVLALVKLLATGDI